MNSSDKTVLVTGATGLIGKELEKPLHESGFTIYAITIDENNPDNGIHWLKGSLFDEKFVRECMVSIKPTHLLNMAWATTGDYLTSDINYRFLQAGITLAQAFAENGGKRAVYAGTCFEYKFKDSPLKESDELDPNKSTYTFCKDRLHSIVKFLFDNHVVSFGYGRIFYVFGQKEAKTRLAGMVLDKLSRGERVVINSGSLKKDYMYSKDIAAAFVKLLDCNVEGCVNICTGNAISIKEFVSLIASAMGKENLLDFVDSTGNQPPVIVGSPTKLKEKIGFVPSYSFQAAISEIISNR